MKNIYFYIALLLIPVCSHGQISDINRGIINRIELQQFMGNITVEGTAGDRIIIERVRYNNIPDKLAKQLNTVDYKKSNFDDMHVSKFGQKMTISPSNSRSQYADYCIHIPNDINLSIRSEQEKPNEIAITQNTIEISNLVNDIEIISYASSITLNDVLGPIVCSVYKGNIEASFKQMMPKTESAFSIFNGNVVLRLNENIKCNLGISEKTSLNTDLEIKDGKLNGGGSCSISISVFKGNISVLKLKE